MLIECGVKVSDYIYTTLDVPIIKTFKTCVMIDNSPDHPNIILYNRLNPQDNLFL